MTLTIVNPRVSALARQLATRTGKTQEVVIEEALARMLDELDAADGVVDLQVQVDRILADIDARLTDRVGV